MIAAGEHAVDRLAHGGVGPQVILEVDVDAGDQLLEAAIEVDEGTEVPAADLLAGAGTARPPARLPG